MSDACVRAGRPVRGSQARLVHVLGRYEPHTDENDIDAWPADEAPTWTQDPAQTFALVDPAQTFSIVGPAPTFASSRQVQRVPAGRPAQTFAAGELWTPALLPAAS